MLLDAQRCRIPARFGTSNLLSYISFVHFSSLCSQLTLPFGQKGKSAKNAKKSKLFLFFLLTFPKSCAIIYKSQRSGCGAAGSALPWGGRALPWGGRGRKFKSCHSDQKRRFERISFLLYVVRLSGHFCEGLGGRLKRPLLRSFLRTATQIATQGALQRAFWYARPRAKSNTLTLRSQRPRA